MDLQSALSAAGSVKAAIELTKTILDAKSQVERQAAVSGLQQQLLSVQVQALEANEVIRSLRDEIEQMKAYIASLDSWNTTAGKYELFQLSGGNVAYRPIIAELANTTDHFLCATCFKRKKESVLLATKMITGRRTAFACSECKTNFIIDGDPPAPRS